ncbi:MAG: methyltransferase [Alphaproteobacteria bacterium]
MTLRTMLIATAFVALALPAAAADAKLTAAIAASSRATENSVRDGARHPGASLEFWGLKPGLTVVEISPGGGYWAEILAPFAKQTGGRYIAAMSKVDQKLPAKFSDMNVYGDFHYTVAGKDSGPLGAANSADLVLTARNVHNWLGPQGWADKAMKDFYAVLKPGGILAIEEHRADPRPETDKAKSGYVSTQHVIDLATKAGFKLDAKSEINANPRDTKDHPFGVWTLPPSRQSSEVKDKPSPAGFDRAKYDAIGESDRMTLRFRKPS